MTVLVTGGAGYIGSHVVAELMRRNVEVVVIDNMATGSPGNLLRGTKWCWGDVGDPNILEDMFGRWDIAAVMHFAASTKVEEAQQNPSRYFANNAINTQVLLRMMKKHRVKRLVFSSTAAVYGELGATPVREDAPLHPINAYGSSKAAAEEMIKDAAAAWGLSYVSLRYFNVVGVGSQLQQGYPIEANPAPLFRAVLSRVFNPGEPMPIYGTDYPTPDGTCVRDYVHVSDIVAAHIRALAYLTYLKVDSDCATLNCGYGHGYSVLEVLRAASKVCGVDIPTVVAARRSGDPASVIADAAEIRKVLDWKPQHDNLAQMIGSQWEWEKKIRPHLADR